ncbi:MAG TPA: hypothetical protein VGT60_06750 [Candidatus Limnocylindria bacterium]|nr:hypothetical protein [Candidatus Limnocylindria bacterium]
MLTVPVAPVRLNADPGRLRQALDAMFREVSATSNSVSVDCRTDKGSVAISIGSASLTLPSSAAPCLALANPWAAASGSSRVCRSRRAKGRPFDRPFVDR